MKRRNFGLEGYQLNIIAGRFWLWLVGLHNLKLKMQFLAAEDVREIELPELSRKTKSGPALVEVGYPFETQHAPKICQADIGAHWS